jgi:hypothetical protein
LGPPLPSSSRWWVGHCHWCPCCRHCHGGGWVAPPVAVIVAVVVGRWYCAAVGAPAAIAVAGGEWVVLPVAVVVAMVVGGRCPQRRHRHCGGPRCHHRHRWWVVPPIAVVVIVVMVVGRCLLMPSSLWCPHCGGPIGGASSLVASDSEQNGVGRGTHLCCPQCPCCGGPAGDGASSLVAGGGCE